MKHQSRTQIIATIGPASREIGTLVDLIKSGMDLARLNFSHGSHDDHAQLIANIRRARGIAERNIPIIQDLSGPRISNDEGHQLDSSSLEVITEKDKADLLFGLEQNVDYIAMSFVRNAQDIIDLKKIISLQNAHTPVIAKIERPEAIKHLDEIIAHADGIMIARGDLGDNVPIEELPFLERDIIKACKRAQKPVITATEMMLSMLRNPRPTRAEVTDVAYAVLLGSDAVMLSDETAMGVHPVKTVATMERIIQAAELEHLGNQFS